MHHTTYNTYLLVYQPLDSDFKMTLESFTQVDKALMRLCYLKGFHPRTPLTLEVQGYQL